MCLERESNSHGFLRMILSLHTACWQAGQAGRIPMSKIGMYKSNFKAEI